MLACHDFQKGPNAETSPPQGRWPPTVPPHREHRAYDHPKRRAASTPGWTCCSCLAGALIMASIASGLRASPCGSELPVQTELGSDAPAQVSHLHCTGQIQLKVRQTGSGNPKNLIIPMQASEGPWPRTRSSGIQLSRNRSIGIGHHLLPLLTVKSSRFAISNARL